MNNETIPYVTRNLRHLLAAPNLTEAQRTIITRTLATLSEEFPERAIEAEVDAPFEMTTEEAADALVSLSRFDTWGSVEGEYHEGGR